MHTDVTDFRPLCRPACVSQHHQVRKGGFLCWLRLAVSILQWSGVRPSDHLSVCPIFITLKVICNDFFTKLIKSSF